MKKTLKHKHGLRFAQHSVLLRNNFLNKFLTIIEFSKHRKNFLYQKKQKNKKNKKKITKLYYIQITIFYHFKSLRFVM